jgi:hypothetical protein
MNGVSDHHAQILKIKKSICATINNIPWQKRSRLINKEIIMNFHLY